jgi:hypothetical protein
MFLSALDAFMLKHVIELEYFLAGRLASLLWEKIKL